MQVYLNGKTVAIWLNGQKFRIQVPKIVCTGQILTTLDGTLFITADGKQFYVKGV